MNFTGPLRRRKHCSLRFFLRPVFALLALVISGSLASYCICSGNVVSSGSDHVGGALNTGAELEAGYLGLSSQKSNHADQPAAEDANSSIVSIHADVKGADANAYSEEIQGLPSHTSRRLLAKAYTAADCTDRLLTLKASTTNGDTLLSDWVINNPGDTACSLLWSGITCIDGPVCSVINLERLGLSGTIPPVLGDLVDLQVLDLSDNFFSGFIPAELGSQASLARIDFEGNLLSGTIPTSLSKMPVMYELDLEYNRLSGFIPADLGKYLPRSLMYELDLGKNYFSGNIPPELASLYGIDYLDLDYNRLSGFIPPELGIHLGSLVELYVQYNHLSGTLPAELGQMTDMHWLYAYHNELSGTIPSALGSLSNLYTLLISDNHFRGTIPAEMGLLYDLEEMDVSNNPYICGPNPTVPDTDPVPPTFDREGTWPDYICPFCFDTAPGPLPDSPYCSSPRPVCAANAACVPTINPSCAFDAGLDATCATELALQIAVELDMEDCEVLNVDLQALRASLSSFLDSRVDPCAIMLSTHTVAGKRRHLLQSVPSFVLAINIYLENHDQGDNLLDLLQSAAFRQFLSAFFNINVGSLQTLNLIRALYVVMSSATSDPHFTTPQGQQFDFNGDANQTYCVAKDGPLQVNARFTGAANSDGSPRPSPSAAKRDARTWMDQVAILVGDDRVLVDAASAPNVSFALASGRLLVNGKPLQGQRAARHLASGVTVSRKKTRVLVSIPNVATVEVEVVRASFWESGKGPGKDYLNLKLREFHPTSNMAGILGHSFPAASGMSSSIVSNPSDYQTSGIFATDCQFGAEDSQK